MKRIVFSICTFFVAAGLYGAVGCTLQPTPTPGAADGASVRAMAAPEEAKLASGVVIGLPEKVGYLRGATNKGNLLVSLWKDTKLPAIGEEVYEYDISGRHLRYLVEPSDPQLTISYVSRFDSSLLWQEQRSVVEGLGWKLHVKNLETGEDAILAQDDLDIPEKTVLANIAPDSPSMNANYVAWDQLTRNGDSFDSQIFLYDLRSRVKRSIARIERGGLESVVERPQLYGNLVVWTKVFYDRANLVAHPDVYLLNIEKGEVRQLTNNGKSFTPVIAKNYLACQYRSTPEDVYGQIELYDLSSNELTRITNTDHHEENWGVTIGSRAVAWQTGRANKAQAYDLASKRLLVLDTGHINRVLTNADVVAWQWEEPRDRIDPLTRRIRFTLLAGDS